MSTNTTIDTNSRNNNSNDYYDKKYGYHRGGGAGSSGSSTTTATTTSEFEKIRYGNKTSTDNFGELPSFKNSIEAIDGVFSNQPKIRFSDFDTVVSPEHFLNMYVYNLTDKISFDCYRRVADCYHSQRYHEAHEIFQEFLEAGVQAHPSLLTVMMATYNKLRDFAGTLRTYRLFKKWDLKPIEHTINHLLHAYVLAPDGFREQFMDEIQELFGSGLFIFNIQNLNALLHVASVHGPSITIKIFKKAMKQITGVPPTIETFNIMIKSCIRTGDTSRAWYILHKLVRKYFLTPDVYTCTLYIQTALNPETNTPEKTERAFWMFRTMREQYGVEPTAVTYVALIDGILNLPKASVGAMKFRKIVLRKVLETLLRPNGPGGGSGAHGTASSSADSNKNTSSSSSSKGHPSLQNNLILQTAVIAALAEVEQDMSKINFVYEMMKRAGNVDAKVLSAMMSACARFKQPARAVQLWSDMKQFGVKPNTVLYTALINVLATTGDPQTVRVYEEVRTKLKPPQQHKQPPQLRSLQDKQPIEPDVFLFNTVLKYAAKANDKQLADQVRADMQEWRVAPNDYTRKLLSKFDNGTTSDTTTTATNTTTPPTTTTTTTTSRSSAVDKLNSFL